MLVIKHAEFEKICFIILSSLGFFKLMMCLLARGTKCIFLLGG